MISNKEVPPGFEKDLNNLAIDFDGVIHNFDKGWHDGTCYGEPIMGSIEAIKELSNKLNESGNTQVTSKVSNKKKDLLFKLKSKRRIDRKSLNLIRNQDINTIIH